MERTAPNYDIADGEEVVIGVVQIDGVAQSNASGETGEDAETEEEADGDFGVGVELEVPEEWDRSAAYSY